MDKFNRINYMINDKHKCLQERVIMIAMICLIVYVNGNKKMDGRIYILMWTPSNESPFTIMEMEQKSFTKRNCRFQNCFLTNNTLYFNDVRDFDVILFNAVNLVDVRLPTNRSKAQKYVFASRESPVNFPIPSRYKDVFNVTWTYRLDSDINFAFIVVKNKKGKVIGPSKKVHWMNNNKMKQAPESVISNLRNKKTAAAWLVSHCDTPSQREMFVQKLIKETSKYQLKIDIFGWCGDLKCPKDRMEECYALIESDYYFYLSFENSFCEDYVTEKLLTALKHYAIPIVYGGANYTRYPFTACCYFLEHCLFTGTLVLREISIGLNLLFNSICAISKNRSKIAF